MMRLRVMAALIALGMAVAMPAAAQEAQDWPSRPVHFIVPFPAGGSTDVAARVIAELSVTRARSADRGGEQDGRQRQHRHRGCRQERGRRLHDPGCTRFRQQQPARLQDEHRCHEGIWCRSSSSRASPSFWRRIPPSALTRLPSLIALAKQQPGLRYATGGGDGSPQHIVAQWLRTIAGIKLEQVPYRGGAPGDQRSHSRPYQAWIARLDAR